jgi:hypothetical protein
MSAGVGGGVEKQLELRGACSRDENVRSQCLDTAAAALQKWLAEEKEEQLRRRTEKKAKNPKAPPDGAAATGEAKNCNGDFTDSGYLLASKLNLREFIRHAQTNPFRDVRERCQQLLNLLQVSSRCSSVAL